MVKKKVVTQKDVAERAGVSRGVVSYVINNGPRDVSAETRARVLAAIDELGYRPNRHAQQLILGESTARKHSVSNWPNLPHPVSRGRYRTW